MKKTLTILSAALLFSIISFAQDEHKLKPIQKDYKYGYGYDDNGGIFTIPPKYDDAQYFEEGLASVKLGDKWGFINEQGVTVIPFKYDYAGLFVNGYASVGMNGTNGKYKYGIINKAGVLVIPCKYDGLGDVQEGLISAAVGNKMGFINIKGVVVIPMKFDCAPGLNLTDFSNGFARVQVGNKVEFIDKTGKVIAPPKYPYARDFVEGMAAVGKDTNWKKYTSDGSKITKAWGFINTSGQDVISCQYENVGDFEKGKAKAYLDGYVLEIDKTGKIVDTLTKPAPRYKAVLDSTISTGRINKTGRITVTYNGGFIKSLTLNNTPVYNVSRTPINIDTKKMGLKPGSKATVKIVYTKGTTVKFLQGQGLE
ncbi:MAG: WG repeat-containing protein [Bacteroidia bacterium]